MLTESVLRCFLELADTLNFTRAAGNLHLTQQAVSRNISTLEKDISLQLFERDTHSVRLSPCGKEYYGLVKRLSEEYLSTYEDLRTRYGAERNIIRIGVTDHTDFQFFYDLFDGYETYYSGDLVLQVEQSSPEQLLEQLRKKKLDVVFTLDCFVADQEFEVQPIRPAVMCLCVSKNNPIYKEGAGYEHYNQEPLIMPMGAVQQAYTQEDPVQLLIKRVGLQPSAFVSMPSLPGTLDLLSRGHGAILCTSLNVEFRQQELVLLPIPDSGVQYAAVWNQKNGLPAAKRFAKAIAELEATLER